MAEDEHTRSKGRYLHRYIRTNWSANRAGLSVATIVWTQHAQQRQLKTQIQASAIQEEVKAFRIAVEACLDQMVKIIQARRTSSPDELLKEFWELDRRTHTLSLYGSVELIIATTKLQNALREWSAKAPDLLDKTAPASLAFHKAKTVWLTRARKEIIELRDLTLAHKTSVPESVSELERQMDLLMKK